VKAAVNMGWDVEEVGLSPALPSASLSSYSLWGSAQQTVLLSCECSLFLSLYCTPLYSAITSPSSESSDIC